MIRNWVGVGFMVLMGQLKAGSVVDIYGDESAKGQAIVKQYGSAFAKLDSSFFKEVQKYQGNIPVPVIKILSDKRDALLKRVQSEGNYVYVDYDSVDYPPDTQRYLTIEVIKQEDAKRLHWVTHAALNQTTPSKSQDIIQAMQDYEQLGQQLLFQNEIKPDQIHCKEHHCLFGFDHPQLKPYREIFDKGIRQEKEKIIHTLNEDVSPERRASAAFLVGEFASAEEIIRTLTPHVTDVDQGVRNNAIRVIAGTLNHSKSCLKQLDVSPFIQLLDSPYETDRNKALFVLLAAVENPQLKQKIRQSAKPQLLALSHLKQPNNREPARLILERL